MFGEITGETLLLCCILFCQNCEFGLLVSDDHV